VTGGYIYRGAAIPALAGLYVFGDYCSGTIWTFPRTAGATTTKAQLMDTSYNISGFGEDESGELYVVDRGGTLYRFEP
jgi:hypothetical protein